MADDEVIVKDGLTEGEIATLIDVLDVACDALIDSVAMFDPWPEESVAPLRAHAAKLRLALDQSIRFREAMKACPDAFHLDNYRPLPDGHPQLIEYHERALAAHRRAREMRAGMDFSEPPPYHIPGDSSEI